ncbi:PspC domain-containing protein [Actinophytocola sp.]|uniref:PspC domain-containing protein n=1 Tax=Actinophytocola sp. TaxID=1872138 RepID=UPI002ED85458
MSGTQGSPNAGMAGVEDTVKDFWATRPRRPRRGRKIAGVAAGIANRYRIDPTLVRVGFVVAAIYGGAGVIAYVLGWLFLPEQDDEVSPVESLMGRGRSSTSSGFTVLLGLALIPMFGWFFGGLFPGFPGFLSVVVIVAALYLLHRNRGHLNPISTEPPAAAASPEQPPPMPAMPTMPLQDVAPTMPMATPTASARVREPIPSPSPEPPPRDTPPAWDPLGAAPFAWDLPDPTPPVVEEEDEPAPRRHKSRIGLLTVGVALIAAAVLSMGMGGWISPQHIIGITLAILGAGMVVGSFVRGGRGLIGLAVPLAVVGIGMTTVSPDGWRGVGDIDVKPTAVEQVLPNYERSVGSIQLDLTALPATGQVDTRINLGLGDVTVMLPRTANVELSCVSGVGSVDCLGRNQSGPNNDLVELTDEGSDKGPGGLDVKLTVDVGTGSVEVSRRG